MRAILFACWLAVGCGSATDSAAPAEPIPGTEPNAETGGQTSELIATGGATSIFATATGGAGTLATGVASTAPDTGGARTTGGAGTTGGAHATGGSSSSVATTGGAETGGTRALSCGEKMCQVTIYQNQAATVGQPCVEFFEQQCSQYPAMCSQVCG